ncbi:GntR family transcriptional regulator [Enemella sp. A6]|uniref:GntR family transcriptional regulator n=1 Tax=Enemella sp. A6 TaxID=3440152 RepID=UPI003EB9EB2C
MTTVPMYQQIMTDLELKIVDLPPGTRLPTEATLAREYGVNRLTVREALAALSRQGLVASAQGRGTFVRPPVERYEVAGGREASLSRAMREEGRAVTHHVLGRDHDATPPAWLPTWHQPWKVRTLRIVDGEPWSLTTTWFDPLRLPGVGQHWPAHTSLYDVLAEQYGIHAVRLDRAFAAVPADLESARRLGVELGMPMLRVRGTNADASDPTPVMAVEHLYNGEAVEFSTRFG